MISHTPVERVVPGPIPAPPDFPVRWEQPGDEQKFWPYDRLHFPDPILPLDYSLWFHGGRTWGGLQLALADFEIPGRPAARRINTYLYWAVHPIGGPPEELTEQAKRAEEKIGQAMGRLGETWLAEYLPEIRAHLDWWDRFDVAGAPLPRLIGHLDETIARFARIWEIHFLVIIPSYVAMSLFEEMYRDHFGQATALDAYRLLQGFDNKTAETDRALWELSRTAPTHPEVRRAIEGASSSEVLAGLRGSAAGRDLLDALGAFLDRYGRRGARLGASCPTWVEDPGPVLKNLKDYVQQPDRDLPGDRARLAAERERLVAEARTALADQPPPVREQFEFLLRAAQAGAILTQEHEFWIDYGSVDRVRRVLRELGRRLAAAGSIDQPDDVFYLTLDELREAATSAPGHDRRPLVAARRAEIERFRAITPPAALGTPPPAQPDDPVSRALGKFFGAPPPRPPADAPVVRGLPASAGRARGRARVVGTLAEAGKLRRGDVLVARTTAPAWTPLFATVAAVVTDTGGALCHSAVVAREYRIPAVVGTGDATATLRDGELIEVDGTAGIVRRLEF